MKLLIIHSTDRNLGLDTGFYFSYFVNKNNFDKLCMKGLTGISIMLHAPDEIQSIMKLYSNVAIGSNVMISIRPQVTKLSDELHNMKPEMLVSHKIFCVSWHEIRKIFRRNCYFKNERYLRFFKIYTRNNCEMECWANLTLKNCGCVWFYMPSNNLWIN